MQWANWYEQRDRDPTSGPVEDVVNALAGLFSEGYQYCSLNSLYSSDISCAWKIDGLTVG